MRKRRKHFANTIVFAAVLFNGHRTCSIRSPAHGPN